MGHWLKETIAKQGSTRLLKSYAFTSRQIKVPSPNCVGLETPQYIAELVGCITPANSFVSIYSNILLHHGDIFGLDSIPSGNGILGYIPQLATSIVEEPVIENGCIISDCCILNTVHHSAHNFYHFMVDYFSNERYRPLIEEPIRSFYISKESHSFHSEAMKLFLGYSIELNSFYKTYLFKKLALPSLLNKTDIVDFFRMRACHLSPAGSNRRLYISRRNASIRRVVNETELEPILIKYGFEIIECEHLSLPEQVSLFKAAEIVCAPHGAGLTNIIFCNEGTSVIEFILTERLPLSAVFWEISYAAGLRYTLLKGARIQSEVNPHETEGDLYVSPDYLDTTLARLVSELS